MVEEIWKPIKGYEGLYEISNWGRVKSLNYKGTGRAELMKPENCINGYLQVQLSKNGKADNCLIHRLVAQTFLPNPLNKPCVNHKIEGDKGKTMNFVFFNEDGTVDEESTTIEWVTYEENINYGTRNERMAKTQSKKVLQFTLDGEFVREWNSTMECGRNGYSQGNIAACCRGERKSHKGFKWQYA